MVHYQRKCPLARHCNHLDTSCGTAERAESLENIRFYHIDLSRRLEKDCGNNVAFRLTATPRPLFDKDSSQHVWKCILWHLIPNGEVIFLSADTERS